MCCRWRQDEIRTTFRRRGGEGEERRRGGGASSTAAGRAADAPRSPIPIPPLPPPQAPRAPHPLRPASLLSGAPFAPTPLVSLLALSEARAEAAAVAAARAALLGSRVAALALARAAGLSLDGTLDSGSESNADPSTPTDLHPGLRGVASSLLRAAAHRRRAGRRAARGARGGGARCALATEIQRLLSAADASLGAAGEEPAGARLVRLSRAAAGCAPDVGSLFGPFRPPEGRASARRLRGFPGVRVAADHSGGSDDSDDDALGPVAAADAAAADDTARPAAAPTLLALWASTAATRSVVAAAAAWSAGLGSHRRHANDDSDDDLDSPDASDASSDAGAVAATAEAWAAAGRGPPPPVGADPDASILPTLGVAAARAADAAVAATLGGGLATWCLGFSDRRAEAAPAPPRESSSSVADALVAALGPAAGARAARSLPPPLTDGGFAAGAPLSLFRVLTPRLCSAAEAAAVADSSTPNSNGLVSSAGARLRSDIVSAGAHLRCLAASGPAGARAAAALAESLAGAAATAAAACSAEAPPVNLPV